MIKVFAIGKTKEAYVREAVNIYLKRISRFSNVEWIECSKEQVSKSLEKNTFKIILEVTGKLVTSEELAAIFKKKLLEKEIVFYIGDEEGLSKEVREKADLLLSFSRMTFPHELARIMLLEQIYRALSINKGLPYHK